MWESGPKSASMTLTRREVLRNPIRKMGLAQGSTRGERASR